MSDRDRPAHLQHWERIAPELESSLQAQADPLVDRVLREGLALFVFATKDLGTKVRKNHGHLVHLAGVVVLAEDALRGLIPAQDGLSLVSLAGLLNVSVDLHVTLRFITQGPDPAKYADRFFRFAEIERVIDENDAGDGKPMLPAAQVNRLQASHPEWVKPTGKLRSYWTAEDDIRRVHDLAKWVKLAPEYHRATSLAGRFQHGGPGMLPAYRGLAGVAAVGRPEEAKTMALLAAHYCMAVLQDLCDFFDLDVDRAAIATWRVLATEAQAAAPRTPSTTASPTRSGPKTSR